MIAEISEPQTAYPVEVSGWDQNEDFFVEKNKLHWSEQSGKHLLLLRPIVPDALVFLRLLDPMSIDRVRPVPYRAELFETTNGGQCRVRLLSSDSQRGGFLPKPVDRTRLLQVVFGVGPARLREKATIHSERLAGDERGSIAEKEFHGGGNIVRRADAP
jgi:hypothetical protein